MKLMKKIDRIVSSKKNRLPQSFIDAVCFLSNRGERYAK